MHDGKSNSTGERVSEIEERIQRDTGRRDEKNPSQWIQVKDGVERTLHRETNTFDGTLSAEGTGKRQAAGQLTQF